MWYHWISRKVLHAYNGHTRKGLKINTKRINEAVLIRSKQCAKCHKPLYILVRLILKIQTAFSHVTWFHLNLHYITQPFIEDPYQYSLLLTAAIHTTHLGRYLPAILVCVLQLLVSSGLTNAATCTRASMTPLQPRTREQQEACLLHLLLKCWVQGMPVP